MSGRAILIGFLLAAIAAGVVVHVATGRSGVAALCGLATLLALISVHSIAAWLFGWPRLRWDDVTAIFYLT